MSSAAYQKLLEQEPVTHTIGDDDEDTGATSDDLRDTYLEGDLSSPAKPTGKYNTLDEPIKETFLRDLRAVGTKFLHVLYPRQKAHLLREWDLWGPLMLCIFLAMILQGSSVDSVHDGGPQFTEVFVIVWLGSMVVTLNCKLLGGNISFFQSVCVLGYCLLAPCLALVICRLVLLAGHTTLLFIIRFMVSMLGFAWATIAATAFLSDIGQPSGRKALALYPVGLFYFVISWMVVSHSP